MWAVGKFALWVLGNLSVVSEDVLSVGNEEDLISVVRQIRLLVVGNICLRR